MKKVVLLALLCPLWLNNNAQVTIGSGVKPNKGALLDLKMNDQIGVNSNKGLSLPKVGLINIRTESDLGKTIGAVEANTLDAEAHVGLLVYNTNRNEESEATRFCPGPHVWDGQKWEPLIPYPAVQIAEGTQLSYSRTFQYLDPASPSGWPEDKESDRLAGKYELGRNTNTSGTVSPNGTEDVVDQRPGEEFSNTYTVSRFYVGIRRTERQYRMKRSFSCDANTVPDWETIPDSPEIITENTEILDDGVWMTRNLLTNRLPDGTEIARRTPANYADEYNYTPQYTLPGITTGTPNPPVNINMGLLYNWAAAMAVGTPYGPDTLPAANPGVNQGTYNSPDVLYQGICPSGWHLPSNQEWTDMANGLVRNVSSINPTIFSYQLNGNATAISSGVNLSPQATSGVGGYLGQGMKAGASVGGIESGGMSRSKAVGGFDAFLVGKSTLSTGNAIVSENYGQATFFWTSSLNPQVSPTAPNRLYVYHIWLQNYVGTLANRGNFYQGYNDFSQTLSVRCKKNN